MNKLLMYIKQIKSIIRENNKTQVFTMIDKSNFINFQL